MCSPGQFSRWCLRSGGANYLCRRPGKEDGDGAVPRTKGVLDDDEVNHEKEATNFSMKAIPATKS